jgi:hypothetical protein
LDLIKVADFDFKLALGVGNGAQIGKPVTLVPFTHRAERKAATKERRHMVWNIAAPF